MLKPTIAVAIAGVIALSALSPASAATRHKQAAAQGVYGADTVTAPVASRPGAFGAPVSNWFNGCVSDEGYGRYSSCDSGTSN